MGELTKKNNILHYVFFVLYMFVPMVRAYGAFDYAAPQWMYVGFLNFVLFVYFLVNKKKYFSFKLSLPTKAFFIIQIGFFIISLISVTQSAVVSESIINIARLYTFIMSIFLLFVLFINTSINFLYLSLIVSFFLLLEAFDVIYYFFSKSDQLRTTELLNAISLRYGNRNVLAISLALKFPFALYVFYKFEGLKKYASLLLVFATVLSVFLMGARTAILVVAISLITFSLLYFKRQNFSIQSSYKTVLFLFLVSVGAYFVALQPNGIYKDRNNSYQELFFVKPEKALYSTGVTSLVDSNGRADLWSSTFNDFKENPFLGAGIGNWRFTPKEELLKNFSGSGFVFHTHVHNDFLQVLAELGIFGFLFFVTYIAIIVFLVIKLLRNKNEYQMVFATLLTVTIGYLIDAFLNFPHDRTPIQTLWAIVMAFVLSYTHKQSNIANAEEDNVNLLQKAVPFLGLFFLPILFIHVKEYEASVNQYKVMAQIQNHNAFQGEYQFGYEEAKRVLSNDLPYVNQVGMTKDDIIALFAVNDKKYATAIKHLNTSTKKTPNSFFSRSVKAKIYDVDKKPDSAFHYSKMVFDLLPAYNSNFLLLKNIYGFKGQSDSVLSTFKKHLKIKPSSTKNWTRYAEAIRKYTKNNDIALKKIDSMIAFYPKDETLLTYRKKLSDILSGKTKVVSSKPKFSDGQLSKRSDLYDLGNKLFDEGKFPEAKDEFLNVLFIDKTNIAAKFKLGMVELKLKDYKQAILYLNDVIESNAIKSGQPEYNRGFCYFKLKEFESAKLDFTESYHRGFELAKKMDKQLLNL